MTKAEDPPVLTSPPMFARRRLLLSILAALALPASALAQAGNATPETAAGSVTSGEVAPYWRTRAERTRYRQTSDYDETMRFVRQVEGASRWVRVVSYGTSPQGRDLPLVILSKDRAFTPEAALATGKPIVLIQNGIHSGEIEGKDACLALMRDLAALRTRPELLDSAIVLVLPIFSVDAHERRGRYHRINQNGPEEMGWRSTAVGLNLNRDYLKVETAEMRAMIGNVYTRWWPHLLIDNHTSDGADFQIDLMVSVNHGAGTPPSIDRWMAVAYEGRVVERTKKMGHVTGPYFDPRRGDIRQGLDYWNSIPRYSTGYPPLHGRAAVLVETHMLKPYATRVKATYDLMIATLEELNARPGELIHAVRQAESEAVARPAGRDSAARALVLTSRGSERSIPFEFKGYAFTREWSDITGSPVPRYTTTPWDTILPLYRETVPGLTVVTPPGYLVPQEWSAARDRLDLHGVRYRRFARAWTDTVEVARVADWAAERNLNEGHYPTRIGRVERLRRVRTWRPGDLWVPCDQRSAAVAVHLFEPQAPDGLAYWNVFDTVLIQKEYAEDYVMEPIARKMLAENPALRREFEARVAADTSFGKDPSQRVNFFFNRSPWADPEQNVLPVARALRRPPETVLAP